MKNKISIIGSGKTGSTLALMLVMRKVAEEIMLFDNTQNFAKAKAMDLEQSLPLLNSVVTVSCGKSFRDLRGSRIVVIAEGKPKSDTVHREDLLIPNSKTVRIIAQNIRKYAPKAIVIVLSNPYDAMTGLVLKETGFPRTRVMGSAGLLYAARFQTFTAKKLQRPPSTIKTLFVGGGSPLFQPLLRYTKVGAIPITKLFSKQKLEKLTRHTRGGASELISLFGDGAAYVAPAAAAFVAIKNILKPSKTVVSMAISVHGEYGVTGVLNLPLQLGQNGVKKILKLSVTSQEQTLLKKASEHYWQLVKPLNL